MRRSNTKLVKGYSLVEILVVIFIFSVLVTLVTQSIALTLRGSRKSENISDVRAELEHVLSAMERNLRSAKEISACPATANTKRVEFTDQWGNTGSAFECDSSDATDGFIASGSARITSNEINVDCANSSFTCTLSSTGTPDKVGIILSAEKKDTSGVEGSSITITTQIITRSYIEN